MEIDRSTKTYLITGATSGIGLAAAGILASRGAAVIGVGRSTERCRDAEKSLRQAYPQAQVDMLVADLGVQREVARLARDVRDMLTAQGKHHLDGLLNNAGTFTYWFTQSPDGIEMQWAVNHLAPFLLTHHLLPLLQAAPLARVITVSSDSHYAGRLNWKDPQLRRRYNGLRAYENTKLANVLFTLELNRRLSAQSSGIRAFAADPGLVKTDMGLKGTPAIVRWIWKLRRSGGISPEESAQGIVTLLTDPAIQDSPEIYWKHGQPKRASRRAYDREAASKLWELSARMCALPEEATNAAA